MIDCKLSNIPFREEIPALKQKTKKNILFFLDTGLQNPYFFSFFHDIFFVRSVNKGPTEWYSATPICPGGYIYYNSEYLYIYI